MKIANAVLWVHDQDAAVSFYTDQVGLELRADLTLTEIGGFRWVTVGAPSQPDVTIVLMAIDQAPMADAPTRAQMLDLIGRGLAGSVFLTVDDCQATYDQLAARGVEFTEAPTLMPYGIDAAFRDPSGNMIRITEVHPMSA